MCMYSPNPMDFQFPQTSQKPKPSISQKPAVPLTSIETTALVRKVVEIERQAVRQSLENSAGIGNAVKLKLTIDLSRQRICEIPDDAVRIMRRDVER